MYNAPDWLKQRSLLSPNKVALIDTANGGKAITYFEWNLRANRTAHFLKESLGLRKGDRLAILAKNCVEYLDLWFALAKLGGVLQNLNWRLTAGELASLIKEAAPVALVYDLEFAATVSSLREQLANSRDSRSPRSEDTKQPIPQMVSLSEPLIPGDLSLEMRAAYPDTPLPDPLLSIEDPWVICYTGGTTGLPKGAVLSFRAITANAVNTIVSWGLIPDDVTILNSPLFHTGGLNVFTAPLVYLGGTSIVCREFNLEQTFDLLENGGVTVWFGVPTMFVMMQNHPRWEKADFSRMRTLISGGAPCPVKVFERFWEKGVDFRTGYGLTEAGPNTFWLPAEQARAKPGAVGYPLFHVEVDVVDQDGHSCQHDTVGELVIRGPHLFSGYWNNPEATAEALRDGWLKTGDLASFDEEGAFTIVGRLKDMIISGGENIYPTEIENVIHSHPEVVEAALIGVLDEQWGEVGWAIVVLQNEAKVTEKDIIEYCRGRLARYKIPKRVIFVEELPKTGANKVDKKRLRECYGS